MYIGIRYCAHVIDELVIQSPFSATISVLVIDNVSGLHATLDGQSLETHSTSVESGCQIVQLSPVVGGKTASSDPEHYEYRLTAH